jgi:hypothetical protein
MELSPKQFTLEDIKQTHTKILKSFLVSYQITRVKLEINKRQTTETIQTHGDLTVYFF